MTIGSPTALSLSLDQACHLCTSQVQAEVRLSVILADNAVELMLLSLVEDFILVDRWSVSPTWGYDQRVRLFNVFEEKVAAAVEQGWLDADEAEVARTVHYLRNAAYHRNTATEDRAMAAWCPVGAALALRLARTISPAEAATIAPPPAAPPADALRLCVAAVLERIDRVLAGLHECATTGTGVCPPDDELDEVLATAEAAWGVGFIEAVPGRKREVVAEMLRGHVFDGSALPHRQLTVLQLRAWQVEANDHLTSLTVRSTAPWWRTVDRQLTLYEQTVKLANL